MESEILNCILSKIGDYLLDATIRQIGYIYHFKTNIEDVKEEDKRLRSLKDLVQQDVDNAVRNTEEIKNDVNKWLSDAYSVMADVEELEKEMQVESQEQYMAINLVEWERGIMLPDGLMYPNLQILILDADRYGLTLSKASDAFFEGMKALKVLTLTQVQLSMKSLQFLTNLRTLHLKYCGLEGISSLGMLKRLEILSLEGSVFDELPEELGELSQLRLLDLFNCFTLKRIPPNVLRRLSHLEELYIGSSSYSSWAGEGMDAETSNVSLSELNSLRRLTHLLLEIHDKCLPKDFAFSSTLQCYEIQVNGDYGTFWDTRRTIAKRKFSKSRILNIRSGKFTTFAAFKALYPTLEHFNSSYSEFSENIVPTIDPTGLIELKSLQLRYCSELKCIVDASLQQVPATAFSNLVELSLYNFPANGNDILLPKLRKLRLQYLPNLISLCPKNYKTTWPTTLEELALWGFRNFAPSVIVELEAVMKTAFEVCFYFKFM
ncbi:hypothetical protein Pint_04540 [Pistacia integerrima]|uniref:Uncharacterized protein n=1 Tax=Pistacia integerrima TaxID=434235 RepID=A0ACC0Z9S0_9ROSI|nr:hypothetical protein Pint_04540 [Pistacia integerrima]